jgi:signal transduction histidine kinase
VKSIGARLAFWYALTSLLTLGCFFRIGRYLVEQHVIHSLDLGTAAEFEQLQRRIGPDFESLRPPQIQERLVPFSPVRFVIEIHRTDGSLAYRSPNLGDRVIPAVAIKSHLLSAAIDLLFRSTTFGREAVGIPAKRNYNAMVADIGEMRVGEFAMGDLTVRIACSKEQVRSLVTAYQDVFYWLFALMLVVSALIGYTLSRVLLRPLRLIQATATHIGSDNLGERIPVGSVKDELSDLARLLNQMFDRLESSFNQIRRFTAEASHELKTPLSLVRLQAEKLMVEGGLSPAQEESVQVQLEEISRLNQIIEELLFLSRAEARGITLVTRRENPGKFLQNFAQDARVLVEHRGVRFTESHSGPGEVDFDPRWIRQVLLNLLANALNVSARGGHIRLDSELAAGVWRVAVEDDGPGVPPDQREHIFERFVRLESANNDALEKGSGLGLAISRSIIGLHQGRIRAEPGSRGVGLRVVFEIPATPRGAEPAEDRAARSG